MPLNPEAMLESMIIRLKKSALSRLGLARKLGHLEVGKDAALSMLAAQKVMAFVLANDLSKRSISDVVSKVAIEEAPKIVSLPFSMAEMGHALGRGKTGVVALLKSRITDELMLHLNKIKGIET